ncbi:protealysin inhibitor emfourin [Sphingomonas profundi]|uniref:protealysin inhibitor emfourin n=1 Tax=Alterirhizorhabdus profundi TaxID=2681549 RepID=UPI0012E8F99F|nr:protealysin inhibitor emfourin [Sphingomonas profundi]
MKLSMTTHGGWAGRFALPARIDTAALAPADAAEGTRLAIAAEGASRAEEARAAETKARAPEAERYAITIDHGDRSVSLTLSEATAEPACRALLDWMRAHLPG